MTEQEIKRLYAKRVIEHKGDHFKAAISIVGEDHVGTALKMMNEWQKDESVKIELEKIKNECPDFATPGKIEVLEQFWKIATGDRVEDKDKIAALSTYAEIKGYLKSKTQQAEIVNRVMLVKEHGSQDDWEQAALKQQGRLTERAGTVESWQ